MILAVDQALANTGLIWFTGPDPIVVEGKGLLRSKGLLDGNEASLNRAAEMTDEFDIILGYPHLEYIIYEIPPLGNLVQRPESSLLAAMALRVAARGRNLKTVGVSANKAKRVLTGSGNAAKKKVREALYEKYPVFKGLNEHQADAAALIIAHFYGD